MHINWLGQTCVKIQTKNLDKDTKILINGYKPQKGNFPRSFALDIALFSSGDKNSVTLSQDPFVINTLGEFELNNIVIYSIPDQDPDNKIFKIISEGMTIVHLGNIKKEIGSKVMEQIMSPDILFLPVGDEKYLSIKDAVKLVTDLEPRIIIPLSHKCDTDPTAKPISVFISEMGLKPEAESNKVIIKKKDLPQEEMQLFVISKE